MTDVTEYAIITMAQQRERGARAFMLGKSRDSHGMNWHAPALQAWQDGWDKAENMVRMAANRRGVPAP